LTLKSKEKPLRGPLGEELSELRRRALKILRALKKAYPHARVPLNYSNPLELLIATILAAQCTDARVNEVTAGLFKKYRTAGDWAAAEPQTLEDEIRPTGFFRSKAKAISESAADISARFGGRVPDTLEELTSLRGVGRKTANVVLAYAYGKDAIIVDTHFIRLSRRMALTAELDPAKIERDMMALLPRNAWSDLSLMLTWHGRTTCTARKPACEQCPVRRHCPASSSNGKITWKVKSVKPSSRGRTSRKPGRRAKG